MSDNSVNSTIISNPSSISASDLIDEYEKISLLYVKLKEQTDKCEQEIYQLKRNLELSGKRETYLNQELESIAELHDQELIDVKEKHLTETDDLRTRLNNACQTNGTLETELERLKNEMVNVEAEKATKTTMTCSCNVNLVNESILSSSRLEYLEKIESEHFNTFRELDEIKQQLMESKLSIAKRDTELENLKDSYECVQENLKSKIVELEEKTQIIDTMQEKIIELSAELAEYKSGNNDHNKKGNSLFAEVDDQRQKMRDILARQKAHYFQMKRELNEAQVEIRRLRRENSDMHREVQQCSVMFSNANKFHKDSLNDRIGFLNEEVKKLQEKLRLSEAKLVTLAEEKKITWLDSMLDYCRRETDKLKQQLHSCRMQKCEAEDGYFKSEERAAKWRFEALKSRCVIIDREMLLEKHNIPYGSVKNVVALVEKKFKDGSNEMPNVTETLNIVPIRHLSAHPTINDSIKRESENIFLLDHIENDLISVARKEIKSPQKEESINKENVKTESVLPVPCLSQEMGLISVPQYRDINITPQRKKVLQQVTETIASQKLNTLTRENVVNKITSEHSRNAIDGLKTEKNTQIPKNVKQISNRPKIVVQHLILKPN